jgi:hypothetical protein
MRSPAITVLTSALPQSKPRWFKFKQEWLLQQFATQIDNAEFPISQHWDNPEAWLSCQF